MTEFIASMLIAAGAAVGVVVVICLTVIRSLDMRLSHEEATSAAADSEALEQWKAGVQGQLDEQAQQLRDIRTGSALSGLK